MFMLIEVCRVAVSVADRWQGVKQSVRGVGRVFYSTGGPLKTSPLVDVLGCRRNRQMREMIPAAVIGIRCWVVQHDLLQFPYHRV